MKKIISVLFAATLMFVVFACAPKSTEKQAEDTQTKDLEQVDGQNENVNDENFGDKEENGENEE